MLYVRLSDGRELGVPVEWFPRLKNATAKERANWRFIGRGIGIRWQPAAHPGRPSPPRSPSVQVPG
ncbi:MAG: DUF2442 domain-containing protein [Bacillota bacterium]